jgi:hypothetical protein
VPLLLAWAGLYKRALLVSLHDSLAFLYGITEESPSVEEIYIDPRIFMT